jgi:hypothetical protein
MFMKMNKIRISVKLQANITYDPYSNIQFLRLNDTYARIALKTLSVDIQKPHLMAIEKRFVTLIPNMSEEIKGFSEKESAKQVVSRSFP